MTGFIASVPDVGRAYEHDADVGGPRCPAAVCGGFGSGPANLFKLHPFLPFRLGRCLAMMYDARPL